MFVFIQYGTDSFGCCTEVKVSKALLLYEVLLDL